MLGAAYSDAGPEQPGSPSSYAFRAQCPVQNGVRFLATVGARGVALKSAETKPEPVADAETAGDAGTDEEVEFEEVSA